MAFHCIYNKCHTWPWPTKPYPSSSHLFWTIFSLSHHVPTILSFCPLDTFIALFAVRILRTSYFFLLDDFPSWSLLTWSTHSWHSVLSFYFIRESLLHRLIWSTLPITLWQDLTLLLCIGSLISKSFLLTYISFRSFFCFSQWEWEWGLSLLCLLL